MNRVLVFCPQYSWFLHWCRQNDENPRDRKFVVVFDNDVECRFRGKMWNRQEGDRFIFLEWPANANVDYLRACFVPGGWLEAETASGETIKVF